MAGTREAARAHRMVMPAPAKRWGPGNSCPSPGESRQFRESFRRLRVSPSLDAGPVLAYRHSGSRPINTSGESNQQERPLETISKGPWDRPVSRLHNTSVVFAGFPLS
jgi:hypothetical protein